MTAEYLVDMLECEKEAIEEALGTERAALLRADLVAVVAGSATASELATGLTSVLERHEHTRRLLQDWASSQPPAGKARKVGSSADTLRESEQVRSLCNRLRYLAGEGAS